MCPDGTQCRQGSPDAPDATRCGVLVQDAQDAGSRLGESGRNTTGSDAGHLFADEVIEQITNWLIWIFSSRVRRIKNFYKTGAMYGSEIYKSIISTKYKSHKKVPINSICDRLSSNDNFLHHSYSAHLFLPRVADVRRYSA